MGRRLASLPAHFMSGEVEIRHGDLSCILYEATRDHTEYIFGDSISTIAEGDDGGTSPSRVVYRVFST